MKSGIYQIRNTFDGKVYIGRSVNLPTRRRNHFRELANGVHKNIKLQRAYNLHGKDVFVFEILELCEPEQTKDLEQSYIDRLSPETAYNIALSSDGGDTLTLHPKRLEWAAMQSERMRHRFASNPELNQTFQAGKQAYWQVDENRQRKVESFTGKNNPQYGTSRTGSANPFFGKTHTEEAKARLRETSRRLHTEASKAAMAAARSAKYQVDNIIFDQLKDVMDHFGVSRKYVHRRFRSDEFPTWKII